MSRVSKVFNVISGLKIQKGKKNYVLILHLVHHGRVGHPVVDDSINCDGDRVSGQDFLGRDIKSNCSKIYFLVMVNAG